MLLEGVLTARQLKAQESRTLASATQQDSTAMKTLALVTVIFLPGAFMSALFAVPVFQWDAPKGESVVSKRFWVYWAVTIPVTLLVIIPWAVWTRQRASDNRRRLREAREKFKKDIAGLGEDVLDEDEEEKEYSETGVQSSA